MTSRVKAARLTRSTPKVAGRGRVSGKVSEAADLSASAPDAGSEPDLTPTVSNNLRRLRTKQRLSLQSLAQRSGVSRAMLGQIELQQSTPTINVLWKIARALNVPFSALIAQPPTPRAKVLSASQAKLLSSHDGTFTSRALFPFDEPRWVEFYELRLAPRGVEEAEPHPAGTVENLVVNRGALEIRVGDETHSLATGDAIQFQADISHEYRNLGDGETLIYLVMTYVEQVGGW